MPHAFQGPQGAANYLIDRQVRRYRSDLRRWQQQVRQARTPMDAFRIAGQKPAPGNLIRSMRILYSADEQASARSVEDALEGVVGNLKSSDPNLLNLMRLAQGHWPAIYRKIQSLRN